MKHFPSWCVMFTAIVMLLNFVHADANGACTPSSVGAEKVSPALLQTTKHLGHFDENSRSKNSEEDSDGVKSKGTSNGTATVTIPNLPFDEFLDPAAFALKFVTGVDDFAGTETGASITFLVQNAWTNKVHAVDRIPPGGIVEANIRLQYWPSKMLVAASGPDTWQIDTVELTVGNDTVMLLAEDHSNNDTVNLLSDDQQNEDAPKTIMYDIPPLSEIVRPLKCSTKEDVRTSTMGYLTSPPGTPCIFGVDSRDEGSHCILEEEYGSLGWCYTSIDRSSWGSCGGNCPLIGENRILGEKVDRVIDRQEKIIQDYIENSNGSSEARDENVDKTQVQANFTSP